LCYNQLSEEIRLVELDMHFEILIEAPANATHTHTHTHTQRERERERERERHRHRHPHTTIDSLGGRHHILYHMLEGTYSFSGKKKMGEQRKTAKKVLSTRLSPSDPLSHEHVGFSF
jgi:hypothetical protein